MISHDTVKVAVLDVIRKRNYEYALRRWENLPFLKRILTRKPRDPHEGATAKELVKEFLNAANSALLGNYCGIFAKGDNGTYISAEVHYQSIDEGVGNYMYPVVYFLYFDGLCYFRQRIAIREDGSTLRWTLDAPFDDAGVNQLPETDYVSEECRFVIPRFKDTISVLQAIVRENRASLQ